MNELEFIVYSTPAGDVRVDAAVKDETIWMTQKGLAELFGCSSDNISLHLQNIYASGELTEEATAEEISVVRQEGARKVTRRIRFYNQNERNSQRISYNELALRITLAKRNSENCFWQDFET